MNISIRENEAERIYHAIFNRKIPSSVRRHFEVLSKRIESRYSKEEVNKYFNAIKKTCDLEALEVAARYVKKLPVLSEKFKIMVYLAETRPANYNVFVNEEQKFFLSCLLLILSIFRTTYKVAKGMIIMTANKI